MFWDENDLAERFWAKVEKADGCWKWHGAKSQGYGYIQIGGVDGGLIRAHRLSYEMHKGPIPEGLFVRHMCDNPECTNPDHLVVGTHVENMRDIVDRQRHAMHGRTHCVNGHEYNSENTYYKKSGHKTCRVCKREAAKKRLREVRGDKFGVREHTPKTHCPQGHELAGENLYIRPDGYRECRVCRADRFAKFKAKRADC